MDFIYSNEMDDFNITEFLENNITDLKNGNYKEEWKEKILYCIDKASNYEHYIAYGYYKFILKYITLFVFANDKNEEIQLYHFHELCIYLNIVDKDEFTKNVLRQNKQYLNDIVYTELSPLEYYIGNKLYLNLYNLFTNVDIFEKDQILKKLIDLTKFDRIKELIYYEMGGNK